MNIIFGILMDAFFVGVLIWCSVSDLKKREIPNVAILLMLVLATAQVIIAVITGLPGYEYPLGTLYAVPFFFAWRKGLFGGGDVKLLFAIGLYLGVYRMLVAFACSLIVCTGLLVWRAVRRKGMRVRFPLAPILSLGTAAALALNYLI